MCDLYSITKGPQAIRDFARAMRGDVGNIPPLSMDLSTGFVRARLELQ
jgi:hypothetical protein